ncbi:DEAD/DEAH box helicase [Lutibacter sp.]|uniref:DEAD/DEAH box helicase n=1 Tax=Lutibacter sp. TaxID=1925666 RepID=UPI0027360D5B|nr:DEAD/DEAH box helicase [Lutibacter sp.]MDP3313788.1 DEAD/DEAH box helicase [Lutibacter sp.]
MTFTQLGIIEPILKALKDEGYTHPTPIQAQSIPILLKGNDLLGCAQTGTGKTAAFTIPILQHLYLNNSGPRGYRKIKTLIVTPTRELAIQIADNITQYAKYTDLKNVVIFGGVKQGGQTDSLRRGTDILVATPGRLLDLIAQGFITLKDIEFFVLDEADQMLDMGFIHDIKKIIAKLPSKRQSLFFSATMPSSIIELSGKILGNYEQVTVKPEQPTADKIEQAIYFVSKNNKPKLLVHIINENPTSSVLVFSRTKHGADKIVKFLDKSHIKSAAIHGNKSQGARQRALGNFKDGVSNILIATDIAARGIDIDELSLVINFDLPNISETYVHRIGRTGRAKASGIALSFCDLEERAYLKDIQKLIRQDIPVVENHPFLVDETEIIPATEKLSKNQKKKKKPHLTHHKPKEKETTGEQKHRKPFSNRRRY